MERGAHDVWFARVGGDASLAQQALQLAHRWRRGTRLRRGRVRVRVRARGRIRVGVRVRVRGRGRGRGRGRARARVRVRVRVCGWSRLRRLHP